MRTIENLSSELTIVIIAHRLSTVARCDRVLELSHGSISQEISGAAVMARALTVQTGSAGV